MVGDEAGAFEREQVAGEVEGGGVGEDVALGEVRDGANVVQRQNRFFRRVLIDPAAKLDVHVVDVADVPSVVLCHGRQPPGCRPCEQAQEHC